MPPLQQVDLTQPGIIDTAPPTVVAVGSPASTPPSVPARMSIWLIVIFFAITAAVFINDFVHRHDPGFGLAVPTGATPDLTKVLAPFLAVATAIERFWEVLFNGLESFALSTGQVLGAVGKYLNVLNASKQDALDVLSGKKQTADSAEGLAKAQADLAQANLDIASTLKSPDYVALKQAVTLFGSLSLGEIAGLTLHLGFFRTLGIHIWPLIDMVLTGLLIGAGPEPVHQIINSLGDMRGALSGIAQLGQGPAISIALSLPSQPTKALQASPSSTQAPPPQQASTSGAESTNTGSTTGT